MNSRQRVELNLCVGCMLLPRVRLLVQSLFHFDGLLRFVLLDAILHLGSEVSDEPLHRPRRRISQRADGVSLDLSCELIQHLNLGQLGLALGHARHHVVQPRRALTARGALTARLVLVEVRETSNGLKEEETHAKRNNDNER